MLAGAILSLVPGRGAGSTSLVAANNATDIYKEIHGVDTSCSSGSLFGEGTTGQRSDKEMKMAWSRHSGKGVSNTPSVGSSLSLHFLGIGWSFCFYFNSFSGITVAF